MVPRCSPTKKQIASRARRGEARKTMNHPLCVLVVEDREADVVLLQRELERGGYEPMVERVETASALREALLRQTWDLVIADYSLPRFSGLEALTVMKAGGFDLPFIVVSGAISDELAVAAMKAGAHDYLLKGNLARLVPAIERELREWKVRQAHKRAEADLRASEERFRLLIEGVQDYAVVMLDADGRVISWNAGAERITGYSANEIIGQSCTRFYPPEEMAQSRLHRALQVAQTDGRFEEEGWRVRKDGSRFLANVVLTALRDDHGGLRGFAQVTRDITERWHTVQEMQESEKRFRQLTENIRDVIWLTNAAGDQMIFISPAYQEIWGRSCESLYLLPRSWIEAVHRDDRERVLAALQERSKTGRYDQEYQIARPDGSIRWIHDRAFPIHDENGAVYRIAGIAEDITERKQAQAEQARLAAILEATPDFVGILSREGRILYVNQAGRQMIGLAEDASLDETFLADSLPLRAKSIFVSEAVPVALARGVWSGENALRARNGREVPVSQVLLAHKDPAGEVKFFSTIARDITERIRYEAQLTSSREQLRSLAARLQSVREEEGVRIAREIHDELGQALTGFKIDLTWLEKRLAKLDDRLMRGLLKKKVDGMCDQVDETIHTVRRIAAELRPGVLDDLGLEAAIEWQAQEFQNRTGIECRVNTTLEELALDRESGTAVFRIFQETLTNVARHANATRVKVVIEKQDGLVVLHVQDNGRGIAEHDLAAANSLGLLGIRERATLLGGAVSIHGEPGKGTTVTVCVPTTQNAEAEVSGRWLENFINRHEPDRSPP